MTQLQTETDKPKKKYRLRLKHLKNPPHLQNKKKVYSKWMVVRVKNNQERFAKYEIQKGGWRCIAPFFYDANARPRETPMFPGYVFVEEPYKYELRSVRGVVDILPGRMPILVMRNLISQLELGDDFLDITQKPPEIGDLVRLQKGVFAEFAGVYTARSGKGRVRILLKMLGTEREIEVPESYIVKA